MLKSKSAKRKRKLMSKGNPQYWEVCLAQVMSPIHFHGWIENDRWMIETQIIFKYSNIKGINKYPYINNI